MLTLKDKDDHLEIDIGGDQVFQFRVDNSLQMLFGQTGAIIQMEGPFVLLSGGIATEFDPNALESLGPALKQLFMKTVASAKAYKSGRLEVVFAESLELQAAPDPQWESWHVLSSDHDGPAIHCLPGGELAYGEAQAKPMIADRRHLLATASLPSGVRDILAALIPGVHSALGDNLVGVYLRGSLATGEFIDTSDVDFLVAMERPVSEAEAAALIALHERLAALPNPYRERLEGAYIDRASLRRFAPGRRFLTVECETPLRWKVHETSWTIERCALRKQGIALLGPNPKALIDPISKEELRDAVRLRIREWAAWAANPHDPEWLPPRSHQAYVVETMCRALYALKSGELASKRRASEWAVSALPEPWSRLVEKTVAGRADATRDEATITDVLDFVQWVATQGDEFASSLARPSTGAAT